MMSRPVFPSATAKTSASSWSALRAREHVPPRRFCLCACALTIPLVDVCACMRAQVGKLRVCADNEHETFFSVDVPHCDLTNSPSE